MTRDEAISIARTVAYLYRDSHDYLPATMEDSKNWMPHEWVITALLTAAFKEKYRDDSAIQIG